MFDCCWSWEMLNSFRDEQREGILQMSLQALLSFLDSVELQEHNSVQCWEL